MADNVFTVSELNKYIKNLMDSDRTLAVVRVRGELSNHKAYPSGHHYFTLKDTEGSLRCVMFKGSASRLRFKPENGMNMLAFGRVTVYPRDGIYQLYVEELTPDGVGDLFIAFEQLKEKLNKEGLFDRQRKKPLPGFPKRIALITSPAGAVVSDMIRILGARWPLVVVIVVPVRVQGPEAPPEIAGAIRYVNAIKTADIIITGRGGGSFEDLWAFNDEGVARAIAESVIPVISAVGHEPDITISDFAADVRAATPSNAAELAVPDINDIRDMLDGAGMRIRQAINHEILSCRRQLEELRNKRVMRDPKYYIDDKRVMLDHTQDMLRTTMRGLIQSDREQYARLAAALDAMSPLKVLGRGYAIARKDDGSIIKKVSDVSSGDHVMIRLKRDEISCIAE